MHVSITPKLKLQRYWEAKDEKHCLGNCISGNYQNNICKGYEQKCCEYHDICKEEYERNVRNGSNKSTNTK